MTIRGCRLHIALHGCDQARETVGDAFIEESGFARYADTNRLVVLFPQIAGSVVNPHGCWDWWGYSDIDYLGKDAPQIKPSGPWPSAWRRSLEGRPPMEVRAGRSPGLPSASRSVGFCAISPFGRAICYAAAEARFPQV